MIWVDTYSELPLLLLADSLLIDALFLLLVLSVRVEDFALADLSFPSDAIDLWPIQNRERFKRDEYSCRRERGKEERRKTYLSFALSRWDLEVSEDVGEGSEGGIVRVEHP
jgi:hypothetical protein